MNESAEADKIPTSRVEMKNNSAEVESDGEEAVDVDVDKVKEEAEQELKPTGNVVDQMVYEASNLELEVEKFLYVDAWNDANGIQRALDDVSDDQVAAVRQVHEEGNKARADIKQQCREGERHIDGMHNEAHGLEEELEVVVMELNQEAPSNLDSTKGGSSVITGEENEPSIANANSNVVDGDSAIRGKDGKEPTPFSINSELPEGVKRLKGGDASKQSIQKLKEENDLLRKCLADGKPGSFNAFKDHVAGRK